MRNGDYEYYEEDAMGWSAFVAGAFIGAGLALLFAPQTGTELRGMLRNDAARAKDEAWERGRTAWDSAVDGVVHKRHCPPAGEAPAAAAASAATTRARGLKPLIADDLRAHTLRQG